MSDLMRNPDVMAKAQAEVRRVFDSVSPQDHEAKMEELHYIKMVVKESMRLNPVLPLLAPRLCRETCDVGGFQVTKGTRVVINAWAMARSPDYWHDAEKFRPERFEDGMLDFKGSGLSTCHLGQGGEGALVTIPSGWLCWSSLLHAFSTTSTGASQWGCSLMTLTWK